MFVVTLVVAVMTADQCPPTEDVDRFRRVLEQLQPYTELLHPTSKNPWDCIANQVNNCVDPSPLMSLLFSNGELTVKGQQLKAIVESSPIRMEINPRSVGLTVKSLKKRSGVLPGILAAATIAISCGVTYPVSLGFTNSKLKSLKITLIVFGVVVVILGCILGKYLHEGAQIDKKYPEREEEVQVEEARIAQEQADEVAIEMGPSTSGRTQE